MMPILAPTIPETQLSPAIQSILSARFHLIHDTLIQRRQLSYGTAYDHYLCERYVMEICTTLNIQTGGAGGRTNANGIQISRDDVANWLGVPHNI
jgi:hypothetical protein